MSANVVVLEFVVMNKGIATDPEKVKGIINWLVPTTLCEVRSSMDWLHSIGVLPKDLVLSWPQLLIV